MPCIFKMTTISKGVTKARVILETDEGRKFNLEIEVTDFIKSEAKVLIGITEERATIYRLADKVEAIFGEDLALEFVLAWTECSEKVGLITHCGMCGAFVWGQTRQGRIFWMDVFEALELIASA